MTMTPEQGLTFYNQLRKARDYAIRDAEGFQEIVFAIERMGVVLSKKVGTLNDYKPFILELEKQSVLAKDIPGKWRDVHAPAWWLYETVQAARNDALHQGAFARHLTKHAIELSLILEDALMAQIARVADFMVRDPVCAQLWNPLSFVRQQMLTNSFSFLPVFDSDKCWKFISDHALAACLRTNAKERKRRMALKVEEAVGNEQGVSKLLNLEKADIVPADCPIVDVVDKLGRQPILISRSDDSKEVVGILTAFDVL
ncbi:MAG: hypothetical protein AB1631_09205 [Acidobacteriota bacterium]